MGPVPFVFGSRGESSAGEGSGDSPRCLRHFLSAFNIASLTAICRSLFPFPTVVNHQLLSESRAKSFILGVQRSELQWQTVIDTAKKLAEKNPDVHERTLFIMSIFYSMYLRISELTSSDRWTPKMNDFAR